jgi:hypothetical protein
MELAEVPIRNTESEALTVMFPPAPPVITLPPRLTPLEEEMLAPASRRRERVLISMFPALPVPPILLAARVVFRGLSARSLATITESEALTIRFPLLPAPKVEGETEAPSVTLS